MARTSWRNLRVYKRLNSLLLVFKAPRAWPHRVLINNLPQNESLQKSGVVPINPPLILALRVG